MQSRRTVNRHRRNPGSSRASCLMALAALSMAAWLSCAHTREATDKPEVQNESDADGEGRSASPSSGGTGRSNADDGKDSGESGTPPRTSERKGDTPVPIASSPERLLQPGAVTSIRDKLEANGYVREPGSGDDLDGSTRDAIRAFQRDRDLPATGVPDDETIRKLGLDPARVFRNSDSTRRD